MLAIGFSHIELRVRFYAMSPCKLELWAFLEPPVLKNTFCTKARDSITAKWIYKIKMSKSH